MTHPTLARFAEVRGREPRVGMATLVEATGTSSSVVGAKTYVDAAGRIVGSVTIGGCVDARAAEAAERVLANGRAEMVDIDLSDEQAWDMGLACGGSLRLLVEPVRGSADDDPVVAAYDAAARALTAGRRAHVIRPLDAPALLVLDAGRIAHGTLGDAARDERVAALVMARAADAPGMVSDPHDGRAYFVESFARPATVAVFGAGEVAVVLARLLRELGMRSMIVDARGRYATRERFPLADELIVADPGEVAAALPAGGDTFVVIVSHDYKFELPVLRHVLRAPVRYIGLLSSRKRGAALRGLLADEGYTDTELSRIRTPIGLDIGARTPAQVALSIAAELVAVQCGRAAP